MGRGSSPHSLSPITDIWRPASPVECRWLSVSRRCAGLHGRLQIRSGSAAEPACDVATAGFRVRLLSPEFTHFAGALHPDPVRMLLRTAASDPLPQGRHRTCSVTIVGLAPRVLSLNPQVAFSLSDGRPPFRGLPQFGSYCASAVMPAIRHFPSERSIRDDPVPFHLPVATPERFGGLMSSSQTAGSRITTLAHSSNYRSSSRTDCVRPKVRNRGPMGVTRLCGWFPRPVPLV
jgi:hypothetical protein